MKSALKILLRTVSLIMVSPIVLACRVTGSKGLFVGAGQLLSLVPGKTGSYLRVAFYTMTLERCESDIHIDFGSFFAHPETEVGRGVYIGAYCVIGMSKIGDHTTIGSNVHILSGKNQHGFREIGKPIQEQGGEFEKVTIGENSWIGNSSVIMADLGVQNIVGAGSVVVKESTDYVVVAGNPAKVIDSLLEKPEQVK